MRVVLKSARKFEDRLTEHFCWVTAALVGGAVVGGAASAYSANKAASAQSNSANLAAQTQTGMFNTVNAQQAPYRNAGYSSLNALMAGTGIGPAVAGGPAVGSLTKPFSAQDLSQWMDPGYTFRLNQGLGALQNSQAATNGLVSGNSLRSLMDYGQQSASQEYAKAFDRYMSNQNAIYNKLSNIAGLGQTSVNNTSQAGMQTASNVGSAQLASGAAQAAGYMGVGNAISSGVNNAMGWYLGNQYLNRLPTGGSA